MATPTEADQVHRQALNDAIANEEDLEVQALLIATRDSATYRKFQQIELNKANVEEAEGKKSSAAVRTKTQIAKSAVKTALAVGVVGTVLTVGGAFATGAACQSAALGASEFCAVATPWTAPVVTTVTASATAALKVIQDLTGQTPEKTFWEKSWREVASDYI